MKHKILAVRSHVPGMDDISKCELLNYAARIANAEAEKADTNDILLATLTKRLACIGEFDLHFEDQTGDEVGIDVTDVILVVCQKEMVIH